MTARFYKILLPEFILIQIFRIFFFSLEDQIFIKYSTATMQDFLARGDDEERIIENLL
jgi:hypothetical protein